MKLKCEILKLSEEINNMREKETLRMKQRKKQLNEESCIQVEGWAEKMNTM